LAIALKVPETLAAPPVVNKPVPVVMALLVVVLRPSVPVPVMSRIVALPASVMAVELIVVRPVPVENVFEPETVVLPASDIPPEPLVRVREVAPVVFPMVITFALLPVPRFTSPVVPESMVRVVVPVELRPVNPVAAPSVETSQVVEFTATVLDPPPIDTAPVEVPVPRFTLKLEL